MVTQSWGPSNLVVTLPCTCIAGSSARSPDAHVGLPAPQPSGTLHIAVIIYICQGQQRALAPRGLAACQRQTCQAASLSLVQKLPVGRHKPLQRAKPWTLMAGTPEQRGLESCVLHQTGCTGRWMPPHTRKRILLPVKHGDITRCAGQTPRHKGLTPQPRPCTLSGPRIKSHEEPAAQQRCRKPAAPSAHAANPKPCACFSLDSTLRTCTSERGPSNANPRPSGAARPAARLGTPRH